MSRFALAALIALICGLAPRETADQADEPSSAEPTTQPAAEVAPRNPQQARIFQELLRDSDRSRGKPILSVPDATRGTIQDGAGGSATLLPDGETIAEVSGRLIAGGNESVFHFNPGSLTKHLPQTMQIHENQLLEAMEMEAQAGVNEFVISAEVTRYRGHNFLLLRKYRRQIDHGNLSP